MEPKQMRCFICDQICRLKLSVEPLFGNTNQYESGKKLNEIVSEIVGKTVKENGHSNFICRDCHKSCMDYDVCQARMAKIKAVLTDQLKKTLPKHNLGYDTYPNKSPIANKMLGNIVPNFMPGNNASYKIVPGNIHKPVVLPASKLRPIKPPPFVVLKKTPQKMVNLTVTLGSTVLTQSIMTTAPSVVTKTTPSTSLVEEIASLTDSKEHLYLDSSILTSSSNSILGFNSLPTNIFDSGKKSDIDKDILAKSMEVINENDTMDIDEECTFTLKSMKSEGIKSEEYTVEINCPITENNEIDEMTESTEIIGDNNDDNNIVIGDLEILDDGIQNDDEEHTILMEGEDGTLIRVTSGQKFIYGDKEISLIIPTDGNNDNGSDVDNDNDGDEDNDNQDSNDESQIELQMSGDEETANAIIKATKQQGGAFIAVQSGEFYHVKSVKSKFANEDFTKNFVEKHGDEYVCTLCANKSQEEDDPAPGFSTSSAAAIMQHMKSAHAARVYVCGVCGAVLRRKNEYSQHIAEHGPKASSSAILKKFECEICQKKFVSRNILKEHINIHSGERPHTCSVCSKSFASKYTYQAHQKIHLDRPRPFKCNTCEKTFFTQQNLNQHEKTHTGARDFKCKTCGKAFLTQHNLEVHSLVHSGVKSFVCGLCGKAFARKPEIRDHMRTHTGERPFSCSTCGASFAQRSNLQSHVRATHAGDKRHACDTCGQRFKRRRLLQYHVKARHTGERPYTCTVCGASFVYPEHYKKHARIHNGEKPYDCEVCGRQFTSRDSRNAHRFVHSDKKPYECLVCGAGYMRRPKLYRHMAAAGHLTESIVVNQPKISKEGDKETIELLTEATIKEPTASSSLLVESGDAEAPALLLPVPLSEELVEITKSTNLGDFQITEGQEEILANDESGALVRLVQISLPGGGTGWVAVS